MSIMSSQRRKLIVGAKPSPKRNYAKGDYTRWLETAKATLAGLFKVKEYYKHRTHQKALVRADNEERARLSQPLWERQL